MSGCTGDSSPPAGSRGATWGTFRPVFTGSYMRPELPEGYMWVPTGSEWHDDQPIHPDRAVLHIPGRVWLNTPDECTDDSGDGEWVLDGAVLVCPGCGLDCT
jgi:hypothetical protein